MENWLEISRHPVRLIGTKTLADRLDVSVPHVRRLVRQGKLPKPIKIGDRKNGWTEDTVDEVIAARRAAAGQTA